MGKYSETLMDHFSAPRNGGVLEGADLLGRAGTPGRGPFVILYLRVRDGRVAQAKYQTHGCGPTIAAGRQHLRVDGRGNRTTYVFDGAGRNTGRRYPDASRVTLAYDAAGQRTLAHDATGRTTVGVRIVGILPCCIWCNDGNGSDPNGKCSDCCDHFLRGHAAVICKLGCASKLK